MNVEDDISDEEIDEEPESTNNQNQEVEDTLASFREQWQHELKISLNKKQQSMQETTYSKSKFALDDICLNDGEEKAKIWYMKGAELERSGKFYEAIQYYKKAVQLVPNIEFKVCQKGVISSENFEHDKNLTNNFNVPIDEEEEDADKITEGMLLQHIQRKFAQSSLFCTPEYEQRSVHISCLPHEIFLYIFKWVVSADLDLRSLDVCSMVSRGFYIMARDQEIWRTACMRVWGGSCGHPNHEYPTWRDMYLRRPRLHFNGCYISKTTYIRHGENSFQDQFYRPWHLVCYYRYLRFFPDGLVLMITTPDEPRVSVGQMKTRSSKTVLRGHYRLKDDRVILLVQDQQRLTKTKSIKTRTNKWQHESGEQTFHLEFQILDHGKRKHVQLAWKFYSLLIKNKNGTESKSSFDISQGRFPPLWFSRVKSYTSETNSLLV